jgi:hypothetical protein
MYLIHNGTRKLVKVINVETDDCLTMKVQNQKKEREEEEEEKEKEEKIINHV